MGPQCRRRRSQSYKHMSYPNSFVIALACGCREWGFPSFVDLANGALADKAISRAVIQTYQTSKEKNGMNSE